MLILLFHNHSRPLRSVHACWAQLSFPFCHAHLLCSGTRDAMRVWMFGNAMCALKFQISTPLIFVDPTKTQQDTRVYMFVELHALRYWCVCVCVCDDQCLLGSKFAAPSLAGIPSIPPSLCPAGVAHDLPAGGLGQRILAPFRVKMCVVQFAAVAGCVWD